jgi:hypothetical protein
MKTPNPLGGEVVDKSSDLGNHSFSIQPFGRGEYRMPVKKDIKRDLYKCTVLGDTVNIEMLYEVHSSPDREKLVRFGCVDCTKCGVGTRISAWETKLDWVKCPHPLSPKA